MQSVGRYARLFQAPGFAYLFGTSLLARLPQGTAGLAITLLVTRDASYARAGAVVAVYVAGGAIASPLLGRLVDRAGRAVVLLPASLAEAASLVALAVIPAGWTAGDFVFGLAAGLCTPPVVAAARSLWPQVLPGGHLAVVYALEATLQELIYIAGPALIALMVAFAGPGVALIVVAVVFVVAMAGFCLHPRVRREPHRTAVERPSGAAWRPPVSLTPLICALVLTGGFSIVELATVRFARSEGVPAAAGIALAVWAGGSLLGGLLLGTRTTAIKDPRRRVLALVSAAAVLLLPLAAAPAVWVLVPLLLLSGVAIAPTMGALYNEVATEVQHGRGTEAFSWLAAAFQVGASLGALGGGLVVQNAGPHLSYLVAAGVIGLGLPALAIAALRPHRVSGR